MQFQIHMLLIVCPLVFIAGFIDAIAGGGGLISLPTYLFAGLPPHFALATNKFSSTIGTSFSVSRFIKSKNINYKSAIVSMFSAIIGSVLGARTALALDEKYLKYFLIAVLPIITIFLIAKKDFGKNDTSSGLSNRKLVILSILSGLVIGAYDGFFGPGTGTFLILCYTGLMGFNLTTASGNARLVNFSSNVAALITFILSGKIAYTIGIPAAIFAIIGHWIGAGLAIKNGSKVIKPIFIGVVILLFIKVSFDTFWG